MRMLMACCLVLAGCGYTPPSPTAPTEARTTPAYMTLQASALLPNPAVSAVVSVREADGHYAGTDITCASSTGTLTPLVVRGDSPRVVRVDGVYQPVTITCMSGGLRASADVEVTPWRFRVGGMAEASPQKTTTLTLLIEQRITPAVPLTRRVISWGDGTPVEPMSGDAVPVTLVHRYARPGAYRIVVTVEWAMGSQVLEIEMERRCQPEPSTLCELTWRTP